MRILGRILQDTVGYLIAGIRVDTRKSSEIVYRISTRETLPNHCSNNQPLVLLCFVCLRFLTKRWSSGLTDSVGSLL